MLPMHREFKRLLAKAEGVSEHIIAINLDIRGFSSYCKENNDFDVATYIKTVYSKILEEYFQDASYYKSTGDGLIIIIPFTKTNLKERANSTIESCLNLLENFPSLCVGEPMVCPPTPNNIGIGIARGSACCIINLEEEKVLDYSGRILNLASRLMDMARPSGIVIDKGFQLNLLKDDYKQLFANENVYVRGITTNKPIVVHYTKERTSIPLEYKNPPFEPKWEKQVKKTRYGILKTWTGNFTFPLKYRPLDDNKVFIRVIIPNPKVEGYSLWRYYSSGEGEIRIRRIGDIVEAALRLSEIIAFCDKYNLSEDEEVQFTVTYPMK
jgi:hypothetical protein